ncbi:LacI family DNA-binding transcriptional regulator [Brenneria sp. 4F2]|nr:LacI family DNA-binding transcriptional regulator [Brenneria bubanii]
MTSLKDVAKAAGVSMMTVSRAINEPHRVKSNTLRKVNKAIKKLNYVPSFSAKKIRGATSVSRTLGVLALGTATTPFDVEILRAVEETAQKYGWITFIVNVYDNYSTSIEKLLSYQPAGIIYTTMGFRKVDISDQLLSRNLVLANCITDDAELASYIPDDFSGQYRAINKIVRRRYHHPLCLFLSRKTLAGDIRHNATIKAWSDSGKNIDDLKIHFLEGDASEFSASVPHYRKIIDVLDHYISNQIQFDVVVCGNDRIAFLVYQKLLKHGFRIPDDVGVLGYDNMIGISDLFYPSLTTVALPHYKIGEMAALHIINELSTTGQFAIDCPFIERDSL